MKFTPRTEEEIKMSKLLHPGLYKYEVINAKERTSKTGNPMIELTLKVYDDKGRMFLINDYLLESMQFKLIHFAKSNNLFNEYESGEIKDFHCLNKKGTVEIDIQSGKEKPDGTFYNDKNVVKDYICKENDNFVDSEIPF
jgi:hypothetical protein